ncbi:hypothetical protein DES53_115130 [Roseimicrobium gellanilyticum]|uniref:Uncharacterized protein n=1 Tax=Roseimicrobium gellanilyticum TaxID=748857 RepID=A0A366H501_9BACT|nr:hypothetical protein [Roseimicrobium gellanilyticum]RBP36989.1 hypothetical protein DES53_115130 [Roseimicrobium gellanilyticum]
MPHRIKLATLAILGITLAIVVGYLLLAARVRDPLQFRLLSAPAFVNSPTFGDTDSTPIEIELRNTSSFPIVLYYIEFEGPGVAGYDGGFSYVKAPGMEPEDLIRYPQITIAGHESLRITYHPNTLNVPAMAKEKPDVRYNWTPSVLDKLESCLENGLERYAPEAWSEHLPLIDVTTTLVPLDVSSVQSPSTPP